MSQKLHVVRSIYFHARLRNQSRLQQRALPCCAFIRNPFQSIGSIRCSILDSSVLLRIRDTTVAQSRQRTTPAEFSKRELKLARYWRCVRWPIDRRQMIGSKDCSLVSVDMCRYPTSTACVCAQACGEFIFTNQSDQKSEFSATSIGAARQHSRVLEHSTADPTQRSATIAYLHREPKIPPCTAPNLCSGSGNYAISGLNLREAGPPTITAEPCVLNSCTKNERVDIVQHKSPNAA